MSISPNLRFHLQGIDGPDKSWENIEDIFGKHNVILAHHIENRLMTLNVPMIFLTLKIISLSSKNLDLHVNIVK
jgi:hypothetical protein